MIATLKGILSHKAHDRVIVEVGGVGYEVFVAADLVARLAEEGSECFLHIHTNVREDAITLFGFMEAEEKEMFLILRSVSGIGPKLAMGILGGMRLGDLCQSITAGDARRLTSLPGVGKRTAERICVDLKEKVGHLGSGSSGVVTKRASVLPATGSVAADVHSALTNLGYADLAARQALDKVREQAGEEAFAGMRLEELIRSALRVLA